MNRNDTHPPTRFDELFGELLRTVEEEHSIRSKTPDPVRLIEVRDRLSALRSELAAVRSTGLGDSERQDRSPKPTIPPRTPNAHRLFFRRIRHAH